VPSAAADGASTSFDPIRVFRQGEEWTVEYGAYAQRYFEERGDALAEASDSARRAHRAYVVAGADDPDGSRADGAETGPLRLFLCAGGDDELDQLVDTVAPLGHEIVGHRVAAPGVADDAVADDPDAAVVGVHVGSEETFDVISSLVERVRFPVVAVLDPGGNRALREAEARGALTYVADGGAEHLRASLARALRRVTGSRAPASSRDGALVERAKGILMVRHAVDADAAAGLLIDHSQRTGQTLPDLAEAILQTYLLLIPSDQPR
jgi:AmiR/NasT family two-component response regulator